MSIENIVVSLNQLIEKLGLPKAIKWCLKNGHVDVCCSFIEKATWEECCSIMNSFNRHTDLDDNESKLIDDCWSLVGARVIALEPTRAMLIEWLRCGYGYDKEIQCLWRLFQEQKPSMDEIMSIIRHNNPTDVNEMIFASFHPMLLTCEEVDQFAGYNHSDFSFAVFDTLRGDLETILEWVDHFQKSTIRIEGDQHKRAKYRLLVGHLIDMAYEACQGIDDHCKVVSVADQSFSLEAHMMWSPGRFFDYLRDLKKDDKLKIGFDDLYYVYLSVCTGDSRDPDDKGIEWVLRELMEMAKTPVQQVVIICILSRLFQKGSYQDWVTTSIIDERMAMLESSKGIYSDWQELYLELYGYDVSDKRYGMVSPKDRNIDGAIYTLVHKRMSDLAETPSEIAFCLEKFFSHDKDGDSESKQLFAKFKKVKSDSAMEWFRVKKITSNHGFSGRDQDVHTFVNEKLAEMAITVTD